MRRRVRLTVLGATLLLLLGTASAWAIRAEIGKSFVSSTAAVTPRVLPAHGAAPVQLSSVTRIGTERFFAVDPKHGRAGAPQWSPLVLGDAELIA